MAVSAPDDDLDVHLRGIVARIPAAFEAWLAGAERLLRATLHPFALRLDTEAILQEALLRTWVAAPRLVPDGRPNGLLRLAIRIARNHAVSELRRNRLDPTEIAELEGAAEALGQSTQPVCGADPGLRAVLRHCMGSLPPAPARALQARIRDAGRTRDHDIAARLGMTRNTFLQNITRAKRFIADCLKRNGVDLAEELT